jgi:hypothetical protein
LAASTVVLVGCGGGLVATYHVGLQGVVRDDQAKERFGVANVAEMAEEDSIAFILEDGLMRITWSVEKSRLPFVLENKTDQPIRRLWDDVILLDLSGAPHKVMHKDVPYAKRGDLQDPTTIAPGESLEDYILAINLAYQESNAEWQEDSFLTPYRRGTREELEPALKNIGRSFVVVLSLEAQGDVHEYVFTFRVRDVELP